MGAIGITGLPFFVAGGAWPWTGDPLSAGSCAAAAARAAARLLLTGEETAVVRLAVPGGRTLSLAVETSASRPGRASCGVRKDAGDDPDVTHGLLILADVAFDPDGAPGVTLRGGEGAPSPCRGWTSPRGRPPSTGCPVG